MKKAHRCGILNFEGAADKTLFGENRSWAMTVWMFWGNDGGDVQILFNEVFHA